MKNILLPFIFLPSLLTAEVIQTDLLIVGGTESGVAAAVQAARQGVKHIVLVNDIKWLGGQFSAEGLMAIDENRGPEGYGHGVPFPRSGLFREVIERIEASNLRKYGRARPGNTNVITTCLPADAEAVFRELLQPWVAGGQVRVVSDYFVAGAVVEGSLLKAVRFRSTREGQPDLEIAARMTVDASDWGDAVKAAGAEYEFGPDLQEKYGEPRAPASRAAYPITDMNPITWCMVIRETDKNEPVPKPSDYDIRKYANHNYPKDPKWIYSSRRLIDHYGFPEIKHPDALLLCLPVADYPLDVLPKPVADALEKTEAGASTRNIVQMTRAQRQIIFDDARRHSLGYLHYLQTVVHDAMPDKKYSLRRFSLTDEFGTPDHLPPKPYVRESLRLNAMYMMRQQDTTGSGGDARNFGDAMYHDGVACWQFEYDFHPTGRRFIDKGNPAGPWVNFFRKNRSWGPPYSGKCVFPLRSLVPVRVDGLLGAQKNLGYSSLVSAALRLHDQSMAVGQAAGAVAAVSLAHQVQPRVIPFDAALLAEVWTSLCARRDGAQPAMLWPFSDLNPDHPAFEAVNLLAARRCLPLGPRDVKFLADQPAADSWKQDVVNLTRSRVQATELPGMPAGSMSRGEFAVQWWAATRGLSPRPFPRSNSEDADSDGLPDPNDPLPFVAGISSWPKLQIAADSDGDPDPLPRPVAGLRQFNFTGQGSKPVAGFENDNGLPFDDKRGFGWSRDISANHRRRGKLAGEWRDSFLFTRSQDRWECVVPNGRYRVTVCSGDSGEVQAGQNVSIEGIEALHEHTTPAGVFAERTIEVDVRDGRLTVELGRTGAQTNTCLNWLRLAPGKDEG